MIKFCTKKSVVHMSISPSCGARELEKLICIRYYIVLKWESRFTFGLNAAQTTDYIKKMFK